MSCTHNIPLVSLRSATQSRARALHAAENNGTELTGTTGPRVTTHSRTELKTVGLYIYYCRACRCLRTPLCWFVIFSSSFSYTPPDLSMKALFSSSSSSLSLSLSWLRGSLFACVFESLTPPCFLFRLSGGSRSVLLFPVETIALDAVNDHAVRLVRQARTRGAEIDCSSTMFRVNKDLTYLRAHRGTQATLRPGCGFHSWLLAAWPSPTALLANGMSTRELHSQHLPIPERRVWQGAVRWQSPALAGPPHHRPQ